MRRFSRAVMFVALLLPAFALPLDADCNSYQCATTIDGTKECRIAFGPHTRYLPYASFCDTRCDCPPDPGNGTVYCECWCIYNYCYDV